MTRTKDETCSAESSTGQARKRIHFTIDSGAIDSGAELKKIDALQRVARRDPKRVPAAADTGPGTFA
jgi:hypothetical protein